MKHKNYLAHGNNPTAYPSPAGNQQKSKADELEKIIERQDELIDERTTLRQRINEINEELAELEKSAVRIITNR